MRRRQFSVSVMNRARIATIVATTSVGLGLACGIAWVCLGRAAIQAAAPGYELQTMFRKSAVRRHPERPLVAWLGDSTLVRWQDVSSYPDILEARSERTGRPFESFTQSAFGLDQFIHYMILERALDLDPAVVFVIANLRVLRPSGVGRHIVQLAPEIPLAEFPGAVFLPWYARSINWARLLLARSLAFDDVADAVLFLEGLRMKFRAQVYSRHAKLAWSDGMRGLARNVSYYDTPISERSPSVVMLSATLERVARRHIPAAVIVAPIPVEFLKDKKLLSPELPARIETLRRAAQSAGAELVDLHDVLEKHEFRDNAGHYSQEGSDRIADSLEPVVERMLGLGRKPG
jgi:hypothetical protein